MPVCSTCGTHYGSTVRLCIRDGTPLVAGRTDDPHLGQILDGKYRIDAFISSGGMGSVYRGVHVMLDKTVAVKVIRNELITSSEVVSRFQREARAASNLDHPNIVSVYDLGQSSDGTLYIAMEFIDGPSLKDLLRKDGPLSPGDAVDILRQVASALAAAHRKQIVHRDLKSHNLMLATEHGRRVAKLVDFGIAKTFDDSTQLTAAGYMLGTPHYMSPEQALGKPVDHRADLYSLGVILYEMLTGEVPFGDAALTSVLLKLATEVPPSPSTRRPDLPVPPALDAVAMRCLEKDPDRRFQSADEFAEALERAHDALTRPIAQGSAPAAATLVRPMPSRGGPAAAAGANAGVPEARPRDGVGVAARAGWRLAAAIVVVSGVALALAFGTGMFDARSDAPPAETARQASPNAEPDPAPVTQPQAPPPAPSPSAAPVTTGASSAPAATPERPPGDARRDERVDLPPRSESAAASPVATPVSASPQPVSPSPMPAQPAAPTVAPAPAPGPPAPVVARATLPVSVACQGVTEVCNAVRVEVVRALQADGVPIVTSQTAADIAVSINVALVSESLSTQFGTPVTTRTFSVELTGSSRGKSVVMPEPRIFGFDPLFTAARLQENARAIGTEAAEAVRAFSGSGTP